MKKGHILLNTLRAAASKENKIIPQTMDTIMVPITNLKRVSK